MTLLILRGEMKVRYYMSFHPYVMLRRLNCNGRGQPPGQEEQVPNRES